MRWSTTVALASALGVAACNQPASTQSAPPPAPAAPAAAQSSEAEHANLPFVGRVWRKTTRGSPLGSIVVFLPDRTLLMGSCVETYRLSEWGMAGDHIRWLEDSPIPIEAEVSMPSKDQLLLKIVGQDEVQSYAPAPVPYVCPEMR